MGPLAITLLMALSIAAFTWLTTRKLALVARLQPEPRLDNIPDRLRTLVLDGLLQRRMIRGEWRPGLMHAVIFLGFLALLLRKLQLIAIGYDPLHAVAGPAGAALAAAKDAAAVAVLAAVGYAFYRRLRLRPKRLEPNREALLVLSLIALIMLSDTAFDGFRFAWLADAHAGIAHERGYAPLGGALATLLAGLSPAALEAGAHASYWLQMVTVFSFLVLLPLGEHFHIVTGLPALFLRRGRPANTVPPVDLERLIADGGEAEMKVGARTAADLTWKEGLDVFTCTECGRCKDACPTFLTGKPLSMKWVNDALKAQLTSQREPILAADRAPDALPPLVPDVISDDTLWACTTCGYCEDACPIHLEHLPRFFRLRQHRVLMDGEFPHELKPVFRAYEVQGNPWALPSDTRGDWAAGLDVPVVSDAAGLAGADYLFYVGSAQSFDPRAQKVARAFVSILRAAGVRFAILGAREPSTGESVRRLGNEMLFAELADKLVATFAEFGVRRVVTCDPHAYNALRNEYAERGADWDVVHHTQLIAQLLAEGRVTLRPGAARVAFHDPCYLGRHNGEYDAPRAVLTRVTREPLVEFPLNGRKSMCCGAGGGRMWMEETLGTRVNRLRCEQAREVAPDVVATACPYCSLMLDDGFKSLGVEDGIAVRDVAELVAESLADR
jgi:Fe-S oxidoreductase